MIRLQVALTEKRTHFRWYVQCQTHPSCFWTPCSARAPSVFQSRTPEPLSKHLSHPAPFFSSACLPSPSSDTPIPPLPIWKGEVLSAKFAPSFTQLSIFTSCVLPLCCRHASVFHCVWPWWYTPENVSTGHSPCLHFHSASLHFCVIPLKVGSTKEQQKLCF